METKFEREKERAFKGDAFQRDAAPSFWHGNTKGAVMGKFTTKEFFKEKYWFFLQLGLPRRLQYQLQSEFQLYFLNSYLKIKAAVTTNSIRIYSVLVKEKYFMKENLGSNIVFFCFLCYMVL